MATTVTVNRQGRITLPSSIRKELNIEEDAMLEVEVRDGGIFLQPAFVIPREDAWAYTPEHRAAIGRARNSSDIPGVTEDDLLAVIDADDQQAAMNALIARKQASVT
ncbi:MAG TPA: AbrB/MazE/SpoVT family DNA-binding domain-containing protein [Thermomicrobiales bacterium]